MSFVLENYEKKIAEVFSSGINILNLSRSLKGISSELQVLAYNGVVLSAKIHTNQGKSLITLSRFLSELPSQIGPELSELEKRAAILADELTLSSLKIKKVKLLSSALDGIISNIFKERKLNNYFDNIDYFDNLQINNLINSSVINEAVDSLKQAIFTIVNTNQKVIKEISDHFFEVRIAFSNTSVTAQRIKRNAFIADYMGSNILIESAYLESHQKNFISFVDDIERIINKLEKNLDDIENRIKSGSQKLSKLNLI